MCHDHLDRGSLAPRVYATMVEVSLRERNPWRGVAEEAPFVAPDDRRHVDAFNAEYTGGFHLDLTLPPDPWLGRWDAPVVMLQMNPSIGPGDAEAYARTDVRALNRRNLGADAGLLPHYWLEAAVAGTYAGRWWRSRLGSLISACGLDTVRSGVLVLEFHGYHAPKHQPLPVTLPSQGFGFELLASALERDAVVVMNRALPAWRIAVPELRSHQHVVIGTNPRSSHLSPGCLGQAGFDLIVDRIRSVSPR